MKIYMEEISDETNYIITYENIYTYYDYRRIIIMLFLILFIFYIIVIFNQYN
jgi:hypothetical protein